MDDEPMISQTGVRSPARSASCGGCAGLGAHARWCPEVVGPTASMLGRWSEEVDELADRVGPNSTGGANFLYMASGRLRTEAESAKEEFSGAMWQSQHARENPGHTVYSEMGTRPICETCGEKAPMGYSSAVRSQPGQRVQP